ncbi:fasciclin domain-containing protein [Colletotrichum tofieldiae]|nr:fasciclin domain-containing protein [Colletotrichum tofieldiae]GKT89386.1 fasciclin domain-containing protein [Colletotrichum tofieldiae]
MRPSTRTILAAVASAVVGASVVAAQGLDEVLGKQANLTTFRGLVKDHADIFSKLPKSGVTILAPSDSAYLKGQGWDSNKDDIPIALQYGVLNGQVSFGALLPGNSTIQSTLLTDTRFSNVTDGQQVLVTKQPNGDVVVTSGVASRTTALRTDVAFDGGLIQVIDSLMVTPARLETTARDAYQEFTSFLGALYTADLVTEFAETKNVTIFAPRNAAFQQVAGTLSGMSKEALRRVLRYHLAPVFTVTGTVETGTAAPTPFISALPCTADCPVTGGGSGGGGAGRTATGGVAQSSSTGGVAAARCTGGLVGAAAGVGLSLALGVVGMGALGAIA